MAVGSLDSGLGLVVSAAGCVVFPVHSAHQEVSTQGPRVPSAPRPFHTGRGSGWGSTRVSPSESLALGRASGVREGVCKGGGWDLHPTPACPWSRGWGPPRGPCPGLGLALRHCSAGKITHLLFLN